MACPLVTRRVYQALHCPLTLGGVERRPFFPALVVGAAVFNLFYSFLAGLLTTGCLYAFAVWSTQHDPQMLRILLSSSRFRTRYDAAKHTPFTVEVRA